MKPFAAEDVPAPLRWDCKTAAKLEVPLPAVPAPMRWDCKTAAKLEVPLPAAPAPLRWDCKTVAKLEVPLPAAPAPSGNRVKDVLEAGVRLLASHKTEPARLLAERILEGLLGCKRYELYVNASRPLGRSQIDTYFSFLRKRIEGLPSQYILGRADFMDFQFRVSPTVLIPRPETEVLVEKILEHLAAKGLQAERLDILDLGTGSGNIAVSLASYLPKASLWAVDISDEALQVARFNAMRHEVAHRIHFVESDMFQGLPAGKKFDVIVSNPPYLSESDLGTLSPEVMREPVSALLGGRTGTEWIERLVSGTGKWLKVGGVFFFEMGSDQGSRVASLLRQYGWNRFEMMKDYSGWDRVVKAWISLLSREGEDSRGR